MYESLSSSWFVNLDPRTAKDAPVTILSNRDAVNRAYQTANRTGNILGCDNCNCAGPSGRAMVYNKPVMHIYEPGLSISEYDNNRATAAAAAFSAWDFGSSANGARFLPLSAVGGRVPVASSEGSYILREGVRERPNGAFVAQVPLPDEYVGVL